jgi:hypothetical protein
VVSLNGSNDYWAETIVASGMLEADQVAALSPNSQVSVEDGATLALEVGSTGNLFSSGDLNSRLPGIYFDAGSSLGLDTSNAGGNFIYSYVGQFGLTKIGQGTLTLTASYSCYQDTAAVTHWGDALTDSLQRSSPALATDVGD